ncbi:hypothetical protein V6Z12_A09G186100 [Gossypium hirsutum]
MDQQAEIVCRFATFLLVRSPRFHSSCHRISLRLCRYYRTKKL